MFAASFHKPARRRLWFLYGWGMAAAMVALYSGLSSEDLLAVRESAAMLANKYDPANGRKIAKKAHEYLGVDYVWGGTTADGFDCSGFTRHVYHAVGYRIPRNARGQYKRMHPVTEPGMGDLVFFRTSGNGSISHVGIYVGQGRFIHAPRPGKQIQYDRLESKYWKAAYAGARSIR